MPPPPGISSRGGRDVESGMASSGSATEQNEGPVATTLRPSRCSLISFFWGGVNHKLLFFFFLGRSTQERVFFVLMGFQWFSGSKKPPKSISDRGFPGPGISYQHTLDPCLSSATDLLSGTADASGGRVVPGLRERFLRVFVCFCPVFSGF